MKNASSQKKVTTNEIMDFLVKHMVTKAEFQELDKRVTNLEQVSATKEDLGKFRSDVIDYIDRRLTKQSIELSKVIDKTEMKADRIVDALLDNKLITTTQAKKIHAFSHR